ncbi:EcsC family protein [Adlercreutzia sp. ZJ242]|uniref:EcsC family protein n=1 Tax=Adlercreutzia sp. ZJ242 TaxID=2709409 RepID=UPI0013EBE659|nr:EcsC family protein [Adlercreutzia sp. ZJ242]
MTKQKDVRSAEIDETTAGKILDEIYAKALDGIPKVSKSVDKLADDYLSKHESPEKAAKALVKSQIAKCAASGFITGLGGYITLPVAIPANIGSVAYVQMRMIAAIARIGGYDVESDQVQTMIYMCLTGAAVTDVARELGIKVGKKSLEAAIKKIPGAALVKINQKIGFRFITKFGEKGIVNLGKMIPLAGGVIGGGVDVLSTSVIAKNAIRMFISNENPDGSEPTEEEVEEIKAIEVSEEEMLL